MNHLFLDTNVIVDMLADREGCDDMVYLLSLEKEGKIRLSTSVLSYANILYIMRRSDKSQVKLNLLKLLEQIYALPMDCQQLTEALDMDASDVEDSIQYRCALAAGCDFILTRNLKHYRGFDCSQVTILSPQQYIAISGL